MITQSSENKQGSSRIRSTGTFLREKLNLGADGYVYHPRFMLFTVKVSEGLNQASVSGGATSTGASTEYELRTVLLPEHPYNLELFTLHREATAAGTFLRGQPATMDERGAIFSFKQRPWAFNSSYHSGSIDSGVNRTDSKSYRVNGGYHGSVMSNNASYSHAESVSSSGLRAVREISGFGNNIHFAGISLDSRVNGSTSDQTRLLSPDLQTRTFNWTEQLTAPLPLNFSSNVSYGYQNEIVRTIEDPSVPAREQFNRSSNTAFNLTHRLYQSLVTNYSANNVSTRSSNGEFTVRSDTIGSFYTKSIPTGRLIAGIHFGSAEAERLGTPSVLNEAHQAPLFGSFLLNLPNVIESTIVVQVRDPDTGSLVELPRGGFLADLRGNNVQITIVSVSPLTPQTDPAFVYEFRVSYSLSDESKIVTHSRGYSIKLDILDGHLTPYYNYLTSNQQVVTGTLAGGPDRTTGTTEGVIAKAGSYSGLVEHQNVRSRQNPSESWKSSVEYRKPVAEDTNVTVLVSFTRTEYFPTPAPRESPGFREKRIGTDVKLDRKLPRNNLNLFITGSYFLTKSAIDSDTLSLNTYLTWRLGLLSISGGAQLSRSESEVLAGSASRLAQYYYLTVARKLF